MSTSITIARSLDLKGLSCPMPIVKTAKAMWGFSVLAQEEGDPDMSVETVAKSTAELPAEMPADKKPETGENSSFSPGAASWTRSGRP